MTAEVKYFLDLEDILAVRLECAVCHVSSSFPLSKLTRVPHQCRHCNGNWILPGTTEERAISTFLASLAGVGEALQKRPFKLSLEVQYEEGESPT